MQAVFIFFERCKTREQERGSRYPLGWSREGQFQTFLRLRRRNDLP